MSRFDEPLSIKFIHKPSRSQEWRKRTQGERDLAKNSFTNKQLGYVVDSATKSDSNDATGIVAASDPPDWERHENPEFLSCVLRRSSTESRESLGSSGDLDKQDELLDEGMGRYKLVRKKSGEIVKSNLKDSSYFDAKVSKSLPTTPSYKQVHFGDAFDVKYFHKKDRPTAISASNSPTILSPEFTLGMSDLDSSLDDDEQYLDESSQDVNDLLKENHSRLGITAYPNPHHTHLINWNLELDRFPSMSYDTNIGAGKPVFLERVFISVDKKYLLGHIAVKNISFEKSVTMRYTFDNWATIIELPTIYVPDVPFILRSNGNDLHNSVKHYEFCIKYSANQQEYWDNNNFANYRFSLSKKINNSLGFNQNSVFHPTSGSTDSLTSLRQKSFKPRYSSSYLRRRSSDSKLSSMDSDIDYVKNNFYLSSPLLSNFNNLNFTNDELNGFNGQSNPSTDTLVSKNPGLNFRDSHPLDLKSLNSNLYTEKGNYNSQSYQELIDNYCFFNPNDSRKVVKPHSAEDGSPTEDVSVDSGSSSEPKSSATTPETGIIYNDSNRLDNASGDLSSPTFTVSSLLGT